MQSTRQAVLVSAGGADHTGKELKLYRRRRRGGALTPYEHKWLNAGGQRQLAMLEKMASDHDQSDRKVRRARRNGIAVLDAGRVLPPIVSTASSPCTRPRGAGRPRRTSSSSSTSAADPPDSDSDQDSAPIPAEVGA